MKKGFYPNSHSKKEPTFGRKRWRPEYQPGVGMSAKPKLHLNSKELVNLLEDNNVIADNMKIFEIGAGPGRNLKYIWDKNNTIKLYMNDLWEESMHQAHESWPAARKLITFYELDTLSLFKGSPHTDIDLLISSDHLMHVDYESVKSILEIMRDVWKPKCILLREVKKECETPWKPRLYHDYDMLEEKYDVGVSTESKQDNCYFIKLYRRKND